MVRMATMNVWSWLGLYQDARDDDDHDVDSTNFSNKSGMVITSVITIILGSVANN